MTYILHFTKRTVVYVPYQELSKENNNYILSTKKQINRKRLIVKDKFLEFMGKISTNIIVKSYTLSFVVELGST
jgi:hypothetical protein